METLWFRPRERKGAFVCLLFFKLLMVLFSTLNFRLFENGKHDFKLSAGWMSLSRFEQLLTLNDLVLTEIALTTVIIFNQIIGSQEGSFFEGDGKLL